ncbi:hypothetical protein AAVH_01645 [Aphelenchoides avenae]|nr:hypothetical protein AAVH_01645 [Aphelenchus avenae]
MTAKDGKRKKDAEKSIAEDETIDETKPKEGSARKTKSSSKEARTSDKAVGDRNPTKVTSKGPPKRDQTTKQQLAKSVDDKQQKSKEPAPVPLPKQRSSDREAEKTQRSVRSEVIQPSSSTAATTTVATPTSPSTDCPSMLYSGSEADISASAKVDSEQQSDQVSAGYSSVPNEAPQVEIDDNEATADSSMATNQATQTEHEEMAVSKTACKALESMHKRALFANLLVDSESEALKKYFDGETPYTDKLLLLLDKAMDKLVDRLKPVENDGELVEFLANRSSAKNLLIDAILARPAYLPQCWGGRTLDGG